jgi:hypothetical protein
VRAFADWLREEFAQAGLGTVRGPVTRASSIRRRISAMAGARPCMIASPIRKWPMLSSTSSRMAAMGPTVS